MDEEDLVGGDSVSKASLSPPLPAGICVHSISPRNVATHTSRDRTLTLQSTMTPSAKRRQDAASAKKAKTEARKGHITEISKKRSAMEQAKVCYAPNVLTPTLRAFLYCPPCVRLQTRTLSWPSLTVSWRTR